MKEIPLTKEKTALVDDDDFDWLSQWSWYVIKGKRECLYAFRNIYITVKKHKQVAMHRQIMDAKKGMQVDHINGNGLDNQRSNLRIATQSQNMSNRGMTCLSTSGFKGVFQEKRLKDKWRVQIQHNGILTCVGLFSDKIVADKAYDTAALKYHREFAKLNFPL